LILTLDGAVAQVAARSAEWVGDSSGVALQRIPVTEGRPEDFGVDGDAIMTRLAEAMKSITDGELQALRQIGTDNSRQKAADRAGRH
jgi:hypothetical protein